jgi:hypothetical protein
MRTRLERNRAGRTARRTSRACAEVICAILLSVNLGCISRTPFTKRERQRRPLPEEIVEAKPELPEKKKRSTKPRRPAERRLDELARSLDAEPFPIDAPCVDDSCPRDALDRVFERLDELGDGGEEPVRILHLGDSHIAADYITGTIRESLQYRFGDAGRGFIAIDQRAAYGGRRLHRKGWKRTRIVDAGRARTPFGFSGMSLESRKPGAKVDFQLEGQDEAVQVFYHAHRAGSRLKVMVGDRVIGDIDTRAQADESRAQRFSIPGAGGSGKRDKDLSLVADDAGVKVFGLSFERARPGIFYDAIGPVGADARVYLTLDQKSFQEHMRALKPDLVVVMVGGNDGLLMRKGLRTLEDVRTDHEKVIRALRTAVPEADCMLWSPMDAGEMEGGRIVSKRFISEVRNMQKAAATKLGCAFWDMFESMGAEGSFARWHNAGIMNDDLIHPRAQAGELLGHLFSTAFLEAYLSKQ